MGADALAVRDSLAEPERFGEIFEGHASPSVSVWITLLRWLSETSELVACSTSVTGAFPLYWRISIWGTLGVAATTVTADAVTVYLDGEPTPSVIPATADRSGGYLDAFLSDIGGITTSSQLTTSQVLRATRLALDIQAASVNEP